MRTETVKIKYEKVKQIINCRKARQNDVTREPRTDPKKSLFTILMPTNRGMNEIIVKENDDYVR
jgi:hypothetical protein